MFRLVGVRLLAALLVSLGVVTIVFLFLHLIPGDPVEVMLGESAQPADRDALRVALGLDQSLWHQYAHYLYGLLQLDMGDSLYSRRAVTELIAQRLPATAWLALSALAVALVLAIPLGLLAASRKDSLWDYGAMSFSMIGVSMPNFWFGPMLILVFSLWLGWFPVSGMQGMSSVVLPAVTLGTALAAILSRMLRSTLLEVLGEDFIRTARAKGLSGRVVLIHHAMRNAALPLLTVLGLQLGALLGGAVITEAVFAWPGVGSLIIDSIQRRDYPVVQGCVVLLSLSYVLINMLTDLAYGWLDPRVRLSQVDE